LVRFQIMVDEETFQALRIYSQAEYRDIRAQAGFMIREVLIALGYLPDLPEPDAAKPQAGGASCAGASCAAGGSDEPG
jgi:hypothetical protein